MNTITIRTTRGTGKIMFDTAGRRLMRGSELRVLPDNSGVVMWIDKTGRAVRQPAPLQRRDGNAWIGDASTDNKIEPQATYLLVWPEQRHLTATIRLAS